MSSKPSPEDRRATLDSERSINEQYKRHMEALIEREPEVLKQIIVNPFKALTEGNSLGIIFFAILMGIALILIGDKGRACIDVIGGANAAIMIQKLIGLPCPCAACAYALLIKKSMFVLSLFFGVADYGTGERDMGA